MTLNMQSTENCGVCGKALIYSPEVEPQECNFCGKTEPAQIYCPDGHYICDSCHSRQALDILREVLRSTTSTNPSEILEKVLSHPSVPLHGPEHHAIVPAVIVAAVKNAGYPVPEGAVEKAIERGSKVPGGWCGFYGVCGAAIGAGTAVSVITGATPLTGKARTLANEATSLALNRMLDEGPRCCKRASRRAIEAAVDFLEKRMGIVLDKPEKIACRYAYRNQECLFDDCEYYDRPSIKVTV
jgi:hypothetical protein